jgi:hypothetical protein
MKHWLRCQQLQETASYSMKLWNEYYVTQVQKQCKAATYKLYFIPQ